MVLAQKVRVWLNIFFKSRLSMECEKGKMRRSVSHFFTHTVTSSLRCVYALLLFHYNYSAIFLYVTVTVSLILRYSDTTLLWQCVTLTMRYSDTALLWRCVTLILRYSDTILKEIDPVTVFGFIAHLLFYSATLSSELVCYVQSNMRYSTIQVKAILAVM